MQVVGVIVQWEDARMAFSKSGFDSPWLHVARVAQRQSTCSTRRGPEFNPLLSHQGLIGQWETAAFATLRSEFDSRWVHHSLQLMLRPVDLELGLRSRARGFDSPTELACPCRRNRRLGYEPGWRRFDSFQGLEGPVAQSRKSTGKTIGAGTSERGAGHLLLRRLDTSQEGVGRGTWVADAPNGTETPGR
jgi:hypothetical protein